MMMKLIASYLLMLANSILWLPRQRNSSEIISKVTATILLEAFLLCKVKKLEKLIQRLEHMWMVVKWIIKYPNWGANTLMQEERIKSRHPKVFKMCRGRSLLPEERAFTIWSNKRSTSQLVFSTGASTVERAGSDRRCMNSVILIITDLTSNYQQWTH